MLYEAKLDTTHRYFKKNPKYYKAQIVNRKKKRKIERGKKSGEKERRKKRSGADQ